MNRHSILLLTLASLVAVTPLARAEDAAEETAVGVWKRQFDLGFNLTQSAFSDDWRGGDKGTMNWVLNGDLLAESRVTENVLWSNKLQLAYGQTSQQVLTDDEKVWSRPDKTTDLVLFESLALFDMRTWVEPYVAVRLETQFVDDSNPIGSFLFNPAQISETGGVARVWEKTDDRELISRLGFGFRQSTAKSFLDAQGDESERFTTNDGGFEFQTQATYPLWDNAVLYKGELLAFLPVYFSGAEDLESFDALGLREDVQDYWKAPDLRWRNRFTAQITKYLAVNLYVEFAYNKFDESTDIDPNLPIDVLVANIDNAVRKEVEFKETLALGITYRLF